MELDITKTKKLIFGISIANVDITNVKGTLVIYFTDSFHLGFSTIVENGKLAVRIPPLDMFNFEDDKKYKAELWVTANRDYFTIPWNDEILIKRPISIKTSIKEEKGEEPQILVTKPIVIKE
jgi:hypothetical protein